MTPPPPVPGRGGLEKAVHTTPLDPSPPLEQFSSRPALLWAPAFGPPACVHLPLTTRQPSFASDGWRLALNRRQLTTAGNGFKTGAMVQWHSLHCQRFFFCRVLGARLKGALRVNSTGRHLPDSGHSDVGFGKGVAKVLPEFRHPFAGFLPVLSVFFFTSLLPDFYQLFAEFCRIRQIRNTSARRMAVPCIAH